MNYRAAPCPFPAVFVLAVVAGCRHAAALHSPFDTCAKPDGHVWFDGDVGVCLAGEGSYGQLVRRYGAEGAADVVRRLQCVWISHIHADHHAGLPRLLALRQRLLGDAAPPLPVRVTVSAGAHSRRRVGCVSRGIMRPVITAAEATDAARWWN